jgi:hypothetical protein
VTSSFRVLGLILVGCICDHGALSSRDPWTAMWSTPPPAPESPELLWVGLSFDLGFWPGSKNSRAGGSVTVRDCLVDARQCASN